MHEKGRKRFRIPMLVYENFLDIYRPQARGDLETATNWITCPADYGA
ncbi:hypothetical protein Poly24_40590 [Rosistilla carotiformis]|uniref:Uncharacterized protein n=1 Tax=Rosistilla carotiformis TaxID=2528017 RepID=A0A518JXS5_9BACT|nr:hypothetical protein Poly24_40590 [Rosistilla carotiformis]